MRRSLKQDSERVDHSSRPVSWNYAAPDGGVFGDVHHHGAHPEGMLLCFLIVVSVAVITSTFPLVYGNLCRRSLNACTLECAYVHLRI